MTASVPEAAILLLPLWGVRHTAQFLAYGLPTLLAPGNLPALARMLPCRFVAMTGADDAGTIAGDAGWRRLGEICPAEIRRIDDLIADTSHSTTLTLAYARAIRAAGDPRRHCFLFLVADFLFADGALPAALRRIMAGASGVLAGNFQASAGGIAPELDRLRDPGGAIAMAPRRLARLGLDHLHPASARCVVNGDFRPGRDINRLFWRLDADTLLGRFYLLHMIAIRPEVASFEVGAPCDYGLVPELCPSDRVVVLSDSDEYLVVEMQPESHDGPGPGPGPGFDAATLARGLSRWTTARHRKNAAHSLIFHAGAVPASAPDAVAVADAALGAIARRLAPAPQPFRNHPSWIGGVALLRATGGQAPPAPASWRWRMRLSAFGRPPDTRPWHPRAPDFAAARRTLAATLGGGRRLLVVSDAPASFARWLAGLATDLESIAPERLLASPPGHRAGGGGRFDAALLVATQDAAADLPSLVRLILARLRPGATLTVLLLDAMTDEPGHLDAAGPPSLDPTAEGEARYIPTGRIRLAVQRQLTRTARSMGEAGGLRMMQLLVATALLAAASLACNRSTRPSAAPTTPCSSLLVTLRADRSAAPSTGAG